jgi:RHS repeat-associated protein
MECEATGTTIARTTTHAYDFQGKRWKTATLEGSMIPNHSHALILQERNAGHTPQVTYTRGLDLSGTIEGVGGIGGLLMRSHGYSSGNWSTHNAYHSDVNGNVTALMNSTGVLQASYKYNPYGGLISSSGSLAGANTMRFSSKPAILSATGAWGFYYYGYRFHDPGMQRWLNRDPLKELGGYNLYAILRNHTLKLVDSHGLSESDPGFFDGLGEWALKIPSRLKDGGKCMQQWCKQGWAAGKETIGTATRWAGGVVKAAGVFVSAGEAAAQTAPGLAANIAIQLACDECKRCLGDPSLACDPIASAACDDACEKCEQGKARAEKHINGL